MEGRDTIGRKNVLRANELSAGKSLKILFYSTEKRLKVVNPNLAFRITCYQRCGRN